MELKQKIIEESDSWEGKDPKFSGKHEWSVVFYFTLAYILFIILDEIDWYTSEGLTIIPNHIVFQTIIATAFFIPIFALATKDAEKWMRISIQRYAGINLTTLVVFCMSLFFVIGILLGTARHQAAAISLESLFISDTPWWLNLMLLMILAFLCLQFPLLLNQARDEVGGLRTLWVKRAEYKLLWINFALLAVTTPLYGMIWDLGYLSLLLPLVPIVLLFLSQLEIFKRNQAGLNLSDLLCYAFSALIMILTPYIPYSFNISLIWAIVVIMYSTELGREHFYYSYVPNSKDLKSLADMVLIAIAVFIPLSIIVGFIDLDNFTLDVDFVTLYRYVIIWTVYVGVNEEVMFRCGLLTLIADSIKFQTKQGNDNEASDRGVFQKLFVALGNRPRTWALIFSSLLFGISHVPKGIDYGFLAIIAGFTYGLLYQKGKNMFGPILLHMTVDVIAVAFFGAQL